MMKSTPWEKYLGPEDSAVLARGRFARRMGFGKRPAVIVIDAQRYMVGAQGADDQWPSSCGATGRASLARISKIVEVAQQTGIPCFFTRFELDPSGKDIGVYGQKRDLLDNPHWCLAGTLGAELAPCLKPGIHDIEFVKKKPSGFHGTPLLGYLNNQSIDTVIVLGGATSNCVRATVFDAASFNYRVIVPHDAVFDRFPVSHAISLFDMDRQFADVVDSEDVINHLSSLQDGAASR